MVNQLKNIKGLTLTELIIASIIMGVVFVGIFSADSALNRMNQSLTQQAAGEMDLFPILNYIAKQVMEASGSPSDPAFCFTDYPDADFECNFAGDVNGVINDITFCIKQSSGQSACFTYVEALLTDNLFACVGNNWRECDPNTDFPMATIMPNTFATGFVNEEDNNPYYDVCTNTFNISLDSQGDGERAAGLSVAERNSASEQTLNPETNLSLSIPSSGVTTVACP